MAVPLLTLLLAVLSISSATARMSDTPHDLVHSSCIHASYPTICLRTLSSYVGPAKTPNDVAQAAVSVTLCRARKVSAYLSQLPNHNGKKREQNAIKDCVEQISDLVDKLHKTLSELRHLRSATFRWQMSNAKTWVSAALTNEDTCLDGFQEVDDKVKKDVKRKISNVARLTSNALYMITKLEETRGKADLDR